MSNNNSLLILVLVIVAVVGIFFAYNAGNKDGTPNVIKEVTREVEKAPAEKDAEGSSVEFKINEKIDLD